jgi:excisionase family DNA binding protein
LGADDAHLFKNRSEPMNEANQSVDEDAPTDVFLRTERPTPTRTRTSLRDGLWDANDVAGYLKVSRSWVYHRAEAGQLPHLRVGGLLRFDAEVVRAFARRR